MEFIITIDTEADNQWDHGRKLTVENIKYVPRFQNLCTKYQIKPTYLVTSEICQDGFAKEIFTDYISKNLGEVGAHLHSWTTPPFLDQDGYRYNDKKHAFATELPEYLLNQKIKNLTGEIESSFGQRPTSFRSGRYGFNREVAKVLVENSYLIDSSVTPYTSWVRNKGTQMNTDGPDFLDHTPFPYNYSFSGSSLLEIPITILPTKFPLNKNKLIAKRYFKEVDKNMPLKVIRKLFFKNQPLWLRPYSWMNIDLFEELINEAININLPYLVMMFHSSELMAGGSIYRSDKKSIDELYELLENFFQLLKKKGITSLTLTEAAKITIDENLFLGKYY